MIRYYSGRPDEHVLVYRNGRVVRGGPGLSCLVTPGSRVAAVPRSISEARLAFTARSADRHRVRVEGDLMFRIALPAKAAASFDFVVGFGAGDAKGDGVGRLSKSVVAIARDILRDEISHMLAAKLLSAEADLGRTTLIRLRHSPGLRAFGVQPVNVFIKDLRMAAEVVDSIEAEALDGMRMRAVLDAGGSPSFPEPPPPETDDFLSEEEGVHRTECTDDCPFRYLCEDYRRNLSSGKAWCTLFREFTT